MPLPNRTLPPGDTPVLSLNQYLEQHGLQALDLARTLGPERVIEQVRRSGLRGRGGAGFPTALKWAGARSDPGKTLYLCCNGAEGEPGTFKDRYLLRLNPYVVLEGVLIAASAINAERAFVCTKGRFLHERNRLQTALTEMQAIGVPGADQVELVFGPDEYLFGEEKALLEVVEGGLPLPRRFAPYIQGLFASVYGGPSETMHNPTVVNNVETLANVPFILREGPSAFRQLGSATSPGTMIMTLSGDVRMPGMYELPLGTSLRALVQDIGGGPARRRRVRAVFSGVANAPLDGDHLDVPLDFDAMREAGSSLGSGGFIVYDDSACMVQVAYNFCNFLHVESCNQCPSCKIGSRRIRATLKRLLDGGGSKQDIQDIVDTTTWVENGARCYLPTSTALVMSAICEMFPRSFLDHLRGRCSRRHDLPLPKMTDYDGRGSFSYDLHYPHKQPDWSYDDVPRPMPVDLGALPRVG